MLILKGSKDQIDVKVTASVKGDLGRITPVTFVATYRKPPASEVKALVERLGDESTEPVSDDELLAQYLLDWKNLQDEAGASVPFTQENLEIVLESMEYRSALVTGMTEVVFGKKALAKN